MTEQEWLDEAKPEPMLLDFLRENVGDRKLRLFAVACCRRICDLFIDQRSQEAVEVAERFADQLATEEERKAAHDAADHSHDLYPAARDAVVVYTIKSAAYHANNVAASASAYAATREIERADGRKSHPTTSDSTESWEGLHASEQLWQSHMLRHIIGNPFRRHPPVASWPATVIQLATAMYNGVDCSFALHDALLDADETELAEHFKHEQTHPKGCWALDLILGKS